MRATSLSLRIVATDRAVELVIDGNVERPEVDPAKVVAQVNNLMAASEHAGAARAHLETAKVAEERKSIEAGRPANRGDMPARPANARKRPSRPRRPAAKKAGGSKSSHSPRAAKRSPSKRK